MRKVLGGMVVAAVTATLLVAPANPAHANLDPAEVVTVPNQQAEVEAFVEAVVKLEPSIVRQSNGTLRLSTTAAESGISQDAYDQVAASIRALNQAVVRGELETTADLHVWPAGMSLMHNGVIHRWWGTEVHFSRGVTNTIIGVLASGGTTVQQVVRVIAPYLPTAALALLIAGALMTLGAVVVAACANNNGVRIFIPRVGLPWCNGHP